MGQEIERKFLVKNDDWRGEVEGTVYRQGYLAVGPPVAVRVRVAGDTAMLNLKKATLDIVREEYEYDIPLNEANDILDGLCLGNIIEKTRYKIPYGDFVWEVDVFHGVNEGLIVAEVELETAEQDVPLPSWVGEEVSGDPRYLNTHLAVTPYCEW